MQSVFVLRRASRHLGGSPAPGKCGLFLFLGTSSPFGLGRLGQAVTVTVLVLDCCPRRPRILLGDQDACRRGCLSHPGRALTSAHHAPALLLHEVLPSPASALHGLACGKPLPRGRPGPPDDVQPQPPCTPPGTAGPRSGFPLHVRPSWGSPGSPVLWATLCVCGERGQEMLALAAPRSVRPAAACTRG